MLSSIINSDKDIETLIACQKMFVSKPKKAIMSNRNISQKFNVFGVETDLEFSIFFTYSERMPSDFSLGLMYDEFLLLRCNGYHGTTKAGFYTTEHHAYPHEHVLSLSDIQQGRLAKPSTVIDLTGEYLNFNGAQYYFFRKCGIINFDDYFDRYEQIYLE